MPDGQPRHLRGGERQRFGTQAAPRHPLADDYFRISHAAYGSRRLVDRKVLDIGLAAALVGELLRADHIDCADGTVVAVDDEPSRSAVTMGILEHIRAEPVPMPVADWLRFVAASAYEDVAQRLLLGRQIVAFDVGVFRKRQVYQPVEGNEWEWVRLDIANRISGSRPLTLDQLFLAGLAYVTNLLGVVMDQRSGGDLLVPQLSTLPPATQTLLQVTHQTVADLARL